jgi:hypothetical protein
VRRWVGGRGKSGSTGFLARLAPDGTIIDFTAGVMPPTRIGNERSFPEIARSAIDELTNLIGAQGRLLRLEFLSDVKQVGLRLVGLAVFAPLLLLGYGLVLVALALALRDALGLAGAFLLVGGVHVLVAGYGLYRAIDKLRAVSALERSREQMKTTVHTVAAAAHETEPSQAERDPDPLPPAESAAGRSSSARRESPLIEGSHA